MHQYVSKIFVFFIAMLLLAGCDNKSLDRAEIGAMPIKNLSQPADNVFASGQPGQEVFARIAKLGVKHVINLRPLKEQAWDEAKHVRELGMQYHFIPVDGAAGMTLENATLLSDTLQAIDNETTLVHCSSSNRVGGLIALREAMLNGADIEAAISEGKRWGLAGLEPVVREILLREKLTTE